MIVGLFIRHYKIFKGMNFIPICNNKNEKYSMILGNNGVGKSSILEAMDTFFNNSNWNLTKDGKKDEALIAPIFLINKNEIKVEKAYKEVFEGISNYFWNVTKKENFNLTDKPYQDFFELKDRLKEKYSSENYYLILAGVQYSDRQNAFFTTFNKSVEEIISTFDSTNKIKGRILSKLKEFYSYIYIPVESKINDILKLENKEMQKLMNEDILEKIDMVLNKKSFIPNKGRNNRAKKSLIDIINVSLDGYLEGINSKISDIDKGYDFKRESGHKKNLTSLDVREKILEAYFIIRTLKKDNKDISQLSSGEQRIALIDMATAFLTGEKSKNKNIILAIDEPENSLHLSKCFSQIQRLSKLSENNQVILTSHWYGSLPITQRGMLNHLEKNFQTNKIDIKSFEFKNYFESRRGLPKDIMIKSYFELSSSILNSMRADGTNWIICEGSSDKLYIENYVGDNIKNLRTFAVGGCGNVRKLYQYLFIPFNEKSEDDDIKGKILLLVDSDETLNVLSVDSETNNKKMKIARLHLSEKKRKTCLNDLKANGEYCQTEIEDCLNPLLFYQAFKESISEHGTDMQKEGINYFELNIDVYGSRIKGENSILKLNDLAGQDLKKHLLEFIDESEPKNIIANRYIELLKQDEKKNVPELFEKITEFFCD
ncbi:MULTISPECIES: AAA family ATPase [Psychrilyobacter]|uniref:Endonuclease GajA/Old nuclease/RecF-like AAA domain-containing protein n=1 Tax=Psychrilyobacter piezotolerans TaxID=2293438 RepID=A0ABX9KHN9_9FUSO|nr:MULTISPECIES: AAA family ATPase [Psychrilyobacter]MCS5420941.1 ATP-binding protein [Psychrilyobacter sp. S5]NDI77652.1 ATP-binding protein [Psychrilyobacter piezotolerans]RDE62660.1 hypothetical protein DV867_06690 [Psychrilyobacter sp. S5]REI41590.1 hypothetical protein DYH56_06690 [Psychrilyobacter piezotolerans]